MMAIRAMVKSFVFTMFYSIWSFNVEYLKIVVMQFLLLLIIGTVFIVFGLLFFMLDFCYLIWVLSHE